MFQCILRVLRTISDHLERNLVVDKFKSCRDFRGNAVFNRILTILCGDSRSNCADDSSQFRRSNVLVEHQFECGFSRKFSDGSY